MKKVLVVDDETGYRDMYEYLLNPMGIEITSVVNGREAVDQVKEMLFDLIIMDVHMPILSGPEAFKEIKKIRPDQKILMFSSSSDPSHKMERELLKMGAVECLYKPVGYEDLIQIIKDVIF
jgi:CheY-like chemotaxis protein